MVRPLLEQEENNVVATRTCDKVEHVGEVQGARVGDDRKKEEEASDPEEEGSECRGGPRGEPSLLNPFRTSTRLSGRWTLNLDQ